MSFKVFTMPTLAIAAAGTPVSLIASVAEVSTITCVADVADSLDQTYFLAYDSAGSVGVWIDTDNSGSAAPAGALAADRQIEVTAVVTGDDATAVAAAIETVVEADSAFSASASSGVLTVTDATAGARTDVTEGDTGFTFAVAVQGRDAQPDIPVMGLTVYAADGNAGLIYVGDSNVSSSQYASILDPEEQWELNDTGSGVPKEFYLSDIYVDASVSQDIVGIAYLKRR